MAEIVKKVRAASLCQASRLLYGGLAALLLWRESDTGALGHWYTALSWLSLLAFVDVGFTATSVDSLSRAVGSAADHSQFERVSRIGAAYSVVVSTAVAVIIGALWWTGRFPDQPSQIAAILGLAAANLGMAVNALQLCLLQGAGHWERSQYLPILPYLLATACVGGGLLGLGSTIGVLATSHCVLSFGLMYRLDRELSVHGLDSPRLAAYGRNFRGVLRGAAETQTGFYFSILACSAIMRISMFAGSLRLATDNLGELGRLFQTFVVLVSACLFPINGLPNRAIGDLRRGRSRTQVRAESLKLIVLAVCLAALASGTAVGVLNLGLPGIMSPSLSLSGQMLLATGVMLDVLAIGLIPLLAYTSATRYRGGSLVVAVLAAGPWALFLAGTWPDFVTVKIVGSLLVSAKVGWDFRRALAS